MTRATQSTWGGLALRAFGLLAVGMIVISTFFDLGLSTPTVAGGNARRRLTAYYADVNPEKIATIDDTIRKCGKTRDEVQCYKTLYMKLEDKYGKRVPLVDKAAAPPSPPADDAEL